MNLFRGIEDVPMSRVCLDCGHEFLTDRAELSARRSVHCPKCGREMPYSPGDAVADTEPPEF